MDALNRTTIGFRPPKEALEGLAEVQLEIRRKAGGIPMRLADLGQVVIPLTKSIELGPADLAAVTASLRAGCEGAPSFSASLGKLMGDPNAIQPKAVSIEVVGGEALDGLVSLLTAAGALRPFGGQALKPVIELVRLKSLDEKARSDLGRAVRMASLPPSPTFNVLEVEIVLSVATHEGPGFRTLESISLVP